MSEAADGRQSTRFLLLYALASAGGAVAYVPFLTILFPMRVTELAGSDAIAWLAYASFAGAATASIAGIAFGWLSDLTGSRRGWIGTGLALSCMLLLGFARVEGLAGAIVLLVAWQIALNMMLGPLSAWAGDCVPDSQKGRLGGLLALSPAGGALAGTIVTLPGLVAPDHRLWLVAALVCACVLPALLFARPHRMPTLNQDRVESAGGQALPARSRRTVVQMWLARLLMQVSEAALFAYIYLWLRSIDPALGEASVAQIFGFVLMGAVPAAILAGRWADRANRPFAPLRFAAVGGATGLAIMALADGIEIAVAGYVLFGLNAGVFLALHTAQTLRVLPRPSRRGRDMGLFNLTNTGPTLIVPWITLAVVPQFGFGALWLILASCALLSALLLFKLPTAE